MRNINLAIYLWSKRQEKGWSQDKLASRARVSQWTLANAEQGKPVYRCTLERIGRALGCLDELFLVAGWAREGTGPGLLSCDLNRLEPRLARSIRRALASGIDQVALAERLRALAAETGGAA